MNTQIIFLVIGLLVGGVIGSLISRLRTMRMTSDAAAATTATSAEISSLQATIAARDSQLTDLKDQLAAANTLVNTSNEQITSLKVDHSAITTQLQEERKASAEKIALLTDAEAALKVQFENVASKIFDAKTESMSKQNKDRLDTILKPFNDQLGDFKKKVEEIHLEETKERATLQNELKHLRELNQQLNTEAHNLTKALKGDKKVQGDWGELILAKVLEASGLRNGHEYETQISLKDDDGNHLRPDVIVHMPDGKDVIVDSKVSLVAYDAMTSAESDEEQDAALKAHILAIRNHIRTLSDKEYEDLPGVRTLDFVLMFIPIEPAYNVAFASDNSLYDDAFKRKIIVVTPTTLLATLKTIEKFWRFDQQSKNTKEIARKAGTMYDKLSSFLDNMQKIDDGIGKLQKTYDDAIKQLSTGNGNVIRQAQQLVTLGVKVKAEIDNPISREALTYDDEE